MDIAEMYPPVEFPVSRRTPALSDLAGWNYTDIWEIPNADDHGSAKGIKNIQININNEKFESLVGHEIKDNIVLPVSCYLVSMSYDFEYFHHKHSLRGTLSHSKPKKHYII